MSSNKEGNTGKPRDTKGSILRILAGHKAVAAANSSKIKNPGKSQVDGNLHPMHLEITTNNEEYKTPIYHNEPLQIIGVPLWFYIYLMICATWLALFLIYRLFQVENIIIVTCVTGGLMLVAYFTAKKKQEEESAAIRHSILAALKENSQNRICR